MLPAVACSREKIGWENVRRREKTCRPAELWTGRDGSFRTTVRYRSEKEEHYIEWIMLETDKGMQMKWGKPGDVPAATFVIAENETVLAAYEYCNLHGLWKAEV